MTDCIIVVQSVGIPRMDGSTGVTVGHIVIVRKSCGGAIDFKILHIITMHTDRLQITNLI